MIDLRRILAGALLPLLVSAARAEFLFSGYIIPPFDGQPNTQFSAWDIFSSPVGGPNYPDTVAPYGSYGSASAAGFTPPANASPADPFAFWDVRNATITQVLPGAFIIGPGSSGNIYSFSGATAYEVANTTPYPISTLALQFQTDGAAIDASSLRLEYVNGSGLTESVAPSELIREYRGTGSSFAGLTSRWAVQWNLAGRNVTTYKLKFQSDGSSNSFQVALLDTAQVVADVVPAARTWNLAGSGAWETGANWLQGSSSVTNGNVIFAAAGPATVTLGTSHTIGELVFATPSAVSIASNGSAALTVNTGLSSRSTASGLYTINRPVVLNAYALCDVAAGEIVLNAPVSGAYSLQKSGEGQLTLNAANTFTGGLAIDGGSLRLAAANAYAGTTAVLFGRLVVAAPAPGGSGALGTSVNPVVLGASSTLFDDTGDDATLEIDGNFNVGRPIVLATGTFPKVLATRNAPATGAVFSGLVNLSTASTLDLHTAASTDLLTFSGGTSGGLASGTLSISGPGTVAFTGSTAYQHTNATLVSSGTLRLSGTLATSTQIGVSGGATLALAGGALGNNVSTTTVAPGGVLRGQGTVHGMLQINGAAVLEGATSFTGPVTIGPQGLLVLRGGSVLSATGNSFVNQGTIDLITGTFAFPPGFVNQGVIVDASSVKLKSTTRVGSNVAIQIEARPHRRYQLQRSSGLNGGSFANVGTPQVSTIPATLTFNDSNAGPSGFYRLVVD